MSKKGKPAARGDGNSAKHHRAGDALRDSKSEKSCKARSGAANPWLEPDATDDAPANDDWVGIAREEMFSNWFYAELDKFDRGEKAQVRRKGKVIFGGREHSNVMLLIPQSVSPANKSNGSAAPNQDAVLMTFFPNQYAKSMKVEKLSFQELTNRIFSVIRRKKDDLPYVKLATFSGAVNPDNPKAGCLRFDKGVVEISGIEGDKDSAPLSFDQAVEKLEAAKLRALLYTSASPGHFRVLCPTSRALPPDQRTDLMKRLNGVLGGALSGESFTLSQSYYFGCVKGKPAPLTRIIEGDCIDLRPDLDAGALGKKEKPTTREEKADYYKEYGEEASRQPIDVEQKLADMESGHESNNIHNTQLSVIAALLNRGVDRDEAIAIVLRRTMEVTLIPSNKTRATQTKILRGMADSWLRKHPELKEATKPTPQHQDAHPPVDLWAQVNAPPLPMGLLPEVIEKFAVVQGELMGADPAGLAMAALTVCAAAIPDSIELQVKQHDLGWRESTRLWTGLVGEVSAIKSPILKEATRTIVRIDMV